MVKTLLEKGAGIDDAVTTAFEYKGETVFPGSTPLMAALANGQNENAYFLMEQGASIDAKMDNGANVLIVAAALCGSDMVKTLIEKGADTKAEITEEFIFREMPVFVGSNALMAAAYSGQAKSVKAMIDAGLDVNAANSKGETALMKAAAKGYLGVVKLLVASGADVNAKTTETYTIGKHSVSKGTAALAKAAYGGFPKTVQFLIDSGADVNNKDEDTHIDALFLAAEKGHQEVVKILIDNGADVFAVSKMGSPGHIANHFGYYGINNMINEAREAIIEKEQEAEQAE
jgi:ankyrin repeat protein